MKSSAKTGPNHDRSRKVMEKISQTGKRCRYSHQTHFTSSHLRRQKPRNSKGFCEDNLPSVNVRAEQSREGRDRPCLQFRYTPLPHQAYNSYLLTKINGNCCSDTHTRQSLNQTYNSSKKRMLPRKAASSYDYSALTILSLVHCFQHLSCRCFLLGR